MKTYTIALRKVDNDPWGANEIQKSHTELTIMDGYSNAVGYCKASVQSPEVESAKLFEGDIRKTDPFGQGRYKNIYYNPDYLDIPVVG